MLPEAAVDGSMATTWAPAPTESSGSLRVDLGKRYLVSRITPHWTDIRPGTYRIVTSTDAVNWTPAPAVDPGGTLTHPVTARYVRADLTRSTGTDQRVGIRELEVIRK